MLKEIGLKIIELLNNKSLSNKSSLVQSITEFIHLHYREDESENE